MLQLFTGVDMPPCDCAAALTAYLPEMRNKTGVNLLSSKDDSGSVSTQVSVLHILELFKGVMRCCLLLTSGHNWLPGWPCTLELVTACVQGLFFVRSIYRALSTASPAPRCSTDALHVLSTCTTGPHTGPAGLCCWTAWTVFPSRS